MDKRGGDTAHEGGTPSSVVGLARADSGGAGAYSSGSVRGRVPTMLTRKPSFFHSNSLVSPEPEQDADEPDTSALAMALDASAHGGSMHAGSVHGGSMRSSLGYGSTLARQESTAHLSRFNAYWAQMIRVANTRGADSVGSGLTYRERAYLFLETPSSSRQAYYFYLFLMAVITLSMVNFVVSTMVSITYSDFTFYSIEYLCTAVFTLEYFARFFTCPDKKAFLWSVFNTVDLLALLPTYIDLIVTTVYPNSTSRQALLDLRLFRLGRMLKLAKTYSGIHIFVLAMERSAQAVWMLLFFLCFGIVFFSSILWFTEKGTGNLYFISIPVAFWWGIVTFATVGYGDAVPTTPQGRWVAGVTIVLALLLLSLPVSVIGQHFTDVLREYEEEHQNLMRKTQALLGNRRSADDEEAGAGDSNSQLADPTPAAPPPQNGSYASGEGGYQASKAAAERRASIAVAANLSDADRVVQAMYARQQAGLAYPVAPPRAGAGATRAQLSRQRELFREDLDTVMTEMRDFLTDQRREAAEHFEALRSGPLETAALRAEVKALRVRIGLLMQAVMSIGRQNMDLAMPLPTAPEPEPGQPWTAPSFRGYTPLADARVLVTPVTPKPRKPAAAAAEDSEIIADDDAGAAAPPPVAPRAVPAADGAASVELEEPGVAGQGAGQSGPP